MTITGMVAEKHAVSASKAKELGMLSPVTGVSALSRLMSSLWTGDAARAVVGAAGPVYWGKLMANVQPIPPIFSEVAKPDKSSSMQFTEVKVPFDLSFQSLVPCGTVFVWSTKVCLLSFDPYT